MRKIIYSKKSLILVILFTFLIRFVNAQIDTRISVQVSPLLSYFKIDYGEAYFTDYNEIESPQLGIRSVVRFEFDIDKYLSLNLGFSYELRKNYLSTGLLYDTSNANLPLIPGPYKYNSWRTYKFYGIPISFCVNYVNNSKIRIYQTFGLQLSFLLSAKYESEIFYEYYGIKNSSGNIYTDHMADNIVSIFSSIGLRRKINEKFSISLEPGFIYMINNLLEEPHRREKAKFFDLKVDLGLTYHF